MRIAAAIGVVLAIAIVRAPPGDAQRRIPTPASIPVLQIPPTATPGEDAPVRQAIEPLPMSERIEIIRKALSSPSPLEPSGKPIRLTPAAPGQGRSGLRVTGELNGAWNYISLHEPNSALTLYYAPVAPGRPHLLECDCGSFKGAHIRVASSSSVETSTQTTFVELATFSISEDDRRLLMVLKPSQPQIQLQLTIGKGETLSVMSCELTPFK